MQLFDNTIQTSSPNFSFGANSNGAAINMIAPINYALSIRGTDIGINTSTSSLNSKLTVKGEGDTNATKNILSKNNSGVDIFELRNDGHLRAHNYGSGTVTGTPTKYLAVEADGDVIEVGLDDHNLYGKDGTLTGDRTVTMGGNDLGFTGGNVGIGTATPTAKTHIVGTGSTTGKSFFVENLVGDDNFTVLDNGVSTFLKRVESSEFRSIANLASANLFLGYNLNNDIVYNAYTQGGTNGNGGFYVSDESLVKYFLCDANVKQVRIGNAAYEGGYKLLVDGNSKFDNVNVTGNVGIGTASPSEKLDVEGTIQATDINFTGLLTFADEAAAVTGGLATGDCYKTATGELRIKL